MILAAIGVAALTSPVTAQIRPNTSPPLSEDNVFWGLENAPPLEHTYGSAHQTRMDRAPASTPDVAAAPTPRIIDCVHVPFPQCSGSH